MQSQFVGGVSLFLIFVTAAAIFADGGFVNISAYFLELYPTELCSRSVGLCQAVNGAGKIAGPLVLGLIAGTGNLVTPEATQSAIHPGVPLSGGLQPSRGPDVRRYPDGDPR